VILPSANVLQGRNLVCHSGAAGVMLKQTRVVLKRLQNCLASQMPMKTISLHILLRLNTRKSLATGAKIWSASLTPSLASNTAPVHGVGCALLVGLLVSGNLRLSFSKLCCPWDVLKLYPDASSAHCKSQKASEVCCLYFGSCQPAGDSLNDDSFAEVMFSKDTATVKAFMARVASELLGVSASDIAAKDDVLSAQAYWAWGQSPVSKFIENEVITLKSLTDKLNEVFPGSKVYTTTTTTTTTTTRTFRTFARLTTKPPRVTTTAAVPFECLCDMEGEVNGIKTNRPGCAMHMGRRYGNFCYMEGTKSCAGAKFSKALKLFYRPCDPELEMGAP